jgi:diacylglycerol kinase
MEHTMAATPQKTKSAPSHSHPTASSLRAFLLSFVYAGQGVAYAIRTQRNMRVHLAFAIFAVGMGIWLRITPAELAVIVVAIMLVVVAEMFNTVIEATVDLATREVHPLAKIAKDMAAGAVLVGAILAVVVGLLILGPPLLARLHW